MKEINYIISHYGMPLKMIFFLTLLTANCGDGLVELLSSEDSSKDILLFNFLSAENPALNSDVVGTIRKHEVYAIVPYAADISALVPEILISGKSVEPKDGEVQAFSDGVGITYAVSAADGSVKNYIVTVNIALNDSKNILSFNFLASENPVIETDVVGTIGDNTVNLTVPYGTNISALVPDIIISGKFIDPPDGVFHEFANGIGTVYSVRAEDGTTKDYSVTVNISKFSWGGGDRQFMSQPLSKIYFNKY